jgi:hypothetical protein
VIPSERQVNGRKRVIRYFEFYGSGCGLSTDMPTQIVRRYGTANVRLIRNATEKDVAWVRGMGGAVPDGRIAKELA